MPELRPLIGLRYLNPAGSPDALLAPPYDVIDQALAAELRSRSPWNAVRLVLPEGDGDARYQNASSLLQEWTRDGILGRDPEAVYAYRQTFRWNSAHEPVSRVGLFAELRLTPFAEGEVLAHEETHAGPKKDRLALTLECQTQLSPVFLVARDPEARLQQLLGQATAGIPVLTADTDDGVHHELWRIDDPDLQDAACGAAGTWPLMVADGHHRYETALVASELLSDLVKSRYLLTFIVSEADPGLRILPTHRVLAGGPGGSRELAWSEVLAADFDIETLDESGALGAGIIPGPEEMVVIVPGQESFRIRPRQDACERAGLTPVMRRISAAVFERLVLRPHLKLTANEAASRSLLSYHKLAEDAALEAAKLEGGAVFILPPVSLDDVWTEAEAGRRMPPKTTYFEPKVPSGLLFRPLEE
ncbi:MAG: DUF1015 domain-containing protein [Gemmatimonadota bacterium]